MHHSGDPEDFILLVSFRYRSEGMQGDVYGTRIEVTYVDTTSEYTVARDSSEHVEARLLRRPGGPNITVMWDDSSLKSWQAPSEVSSTKSRRRK
jgi:hypothetical protein